MTISQILGVVILVIWIVNIIMGRNYIKQHNSVMHATVFQLILLPLIVGIGLIIMENLLVFPIGIAAFFLSFRFPNTFYYEFPLLAGWIYGLYIFDPILPDSIWGFLGGGFIGLAGMVIICSITVAIVTRNT